MNSELRERVCKLNRDLADSGLVAMNSGNASGLDRDAGRLYIKPSGIDYATLTPDMIVEVDLDLGVVTAGTLRPSVDLPHHLALYRSDPTIQSIVHTHSNYATAFAACQKPIPLCLTAIADEFGAEIPCARFAECDEFDLAKSIVESRTKAPAVLLANHGVVAWGHSPEAALKAAVMTEDVAKTVFLAMQVGNIVPLNPVAAEKYHHRYQHQYGQQIAPENAPENAPEDAIRILPR